MGFTTAWQVCVDVRGPLCLTKIVWVQLVRRKAVKVGDLSVDIGPTSLVKSDDILHPRPRKSITSHSKHRFDSHIGRVYKSSKAQPAEISTNWPT